MTKQCAQNEKVQNKTNLIKKILLSIVTIAAVGAVVGGATYSYFSDQESVNNNTFATGTLNLTLNHSAGKPFSVTGAYPGYTTSWEYLDIFNGPFPGQPGQLPFEAYMTLQKTSGDDTLWNALNIEMKTVGGDSDCTNNDGSEKTIYNGPVSAFPYQHLVSTANYWHLANEDDGHGSPADNIRAGYTERVCQRVSLSTSAGNEVQGKTVVFSEIVDALQDND